MRLGRNPFLVFLAISVAFPMEGVSATLHVPSQYPTINTGIDAAVAGDTVLVAPGTYSVPETRDIQLGGGTTTSTSLVFLKDGVRVLSEGGPEVTILDPTGANFEGAAWIVVGGEFQTIGTSLEGFTLTGAEPGWSAILVLNGKAFEVRNCRFHDLDAGKSTGAAVSGSFIVLNLVDCHFVNCHAMQGGAVSVRNDDLWMERCVVENCSSETAAVDAEGDSFYPGLSITVVDCIFRKNTGVFAGALIADSGYTRAKIVENCWFEENTCVEASGAALGMGGTSATYRVVGNTFVRNHSLGPLSNGGAVILQGTHMMIANNTFWANTQIDKFGGGSALFIVPPSNLHLIRNVFAENEGAAAVGTLESLFFHDQGCNVYWNNTLGENYGFPLMDTDRIIDPEFCDVSLDDFTVSTISPCLPTNSPSGCGLIGAHGEGCGPVSIEELSWGKLKSRYR